MRSRALACTLVALFGCDDGKDTGGEELPALLQVYPVDGAAGVSIASRVTAEISREAAQSCRMSPDTATVAVRQGGVDVPGTIVFFVDGLRVDFTPSGMFDYERTYTIDATLSCSAPAHSTFSTRAGFATTPDVQVGDGFRITDLTIDEPGAIAPMIRDFLDGGELLLQVLEVGTDSLRVLGGEGTTVLDGEDINLRVYRRKAFIFPMLGRYKPPYFQIEGSILIPVNDTENITLEHFEISGRFIGDRPTIEVGDSSIRASSACDSVCAVADNDIQLVCANRSTICDAAGDLNLIGNYLGAPNETLGYQTFTGVTPAAGAEDVAPGAAGISAQFTRPVDSSRDGTVQFLLTPAGSEARVAGTVEVATDGLSATFAPTVPLSPDTEYNLLVIAHAASETTFTTGGN
jgi:hypothetical protein